MVIRAPVPETAIHHDRYASRTEHHIGTPRERLQRSTIHAKAQTPLVQFATNPQFRARVSAPYAAHSGANDGIDVRECLDRLALPGHGLTLP